MSITLRRAGIVGVATFGVAALLAGCASAPSDSSSTGTAAASSDFLPCMVSDSGGFDDKSFNQAGYEGIIEAGDELGVKPITVESSGDTDFAPNIDQLISQNCNLVISVGFLLADATKAAAEANPDVNFAIIDDASIDASNVKPITFETSQAAFLAGYAAAAYSKTGTVGTFGGIQIPSVTIFMDGFADGVKYYNEQNGASVKTVGWDVASQTGSFTGGFAAGVEAKTAAQGLIDQGADVILPVGGPIFLSAGEAIRDSGKDIALIGVDSDNYDTAPDLKDLFLTSVLKGVKVGTEDVVKAAAEGDYSAEPFVGTLENDGVGIAPFHDFESKVPSDLQSKLDEIKKGIIDGSIKVESPSSLVG
ncbi:BMP family ABC transporter substrate-binding protein [Cnuibacter physcomitrellae]|uniref:BMP family ABC transporter substrate-binding protein n=1 Tax=Cnuibacter physcomitrellae TaxID=1619308 RepID=A0A1X9LVI1_9MICO|nr:BMP family ABC transporter substrate-binding protein [Cnuibacter physcomitrellae]ARJ06040.1 BMP family ABC transporter substrate-binding protein [Cnuibacter physcomitrellae]GGI37082.1 BMP family ABC transporter substrate-binding protein [Cnuibacter physcomitrellae]